MPWSAAGEQETEVEGTEEQETLVATAARAEAQVAAEAETRAVKEGGPAYSSLETQTLAARSAQT